MKKLLYAAVAAFVVYTSPSAMAQSTVPSPVITITPLVGPRLRTQEFLNNVIAGITGTTSPAIPIAVEDNIVNISSLVCTPTFYSWRGSVAAATGLFATQVGNAHYFTYDISSSTPFNPFDVTFVIQSPFFNLNGSLNGTSYNLKAVGYAADGTEYTTGLMENPVVRLKGIGVSYTIEVGGSGQSDIDNTLKNWEPFDLTATYFLNGFSKSSTVHVGVPEPSSFSLIAVAVSYMFVRRKK